MVKLINGAIINAAPDNAFLAIKYSFEREVYEKLHRQTLRIVYAGGKNGLQINCEHDFLNSRKHCICSLHCIARRVTSKSDTTAKITSVCFDHSLECPSNSSLSSGSTTRHRLIKKSFLSNIVRLVEEKGGEEETKKGGQKTSNFIAKIQTMASSNSVDGEQPCERKSTSSSTDEKCSSSSAPSRQRRKRKFPEASTDLCTKSKKSRVPTGSSHSVDGEQPCERKSTSSSTDEKCSSSSAPSRQRRKRKFPETSTDLCTKSKKSRFPPCVNHKTDPQFSLEKETAVLSTNQTPLLDQKNKCMQIFRGLISLLPARRRSPRFSPTSTPTTTTNAQIIRRRSPRFCSSSTEVTPTQAFDTSSRLSTSGDSVTIKWE